MPETPSLEVTYLPVRDLVPYANNSKIHTEEQIAQIAASIERFGDCDPIGVWHDPNGKPVIVEGHGRMLALEQLGIDEAPVIFLDHLSDEDRRAYSHVHNQTTLSSGLDEDILAADLEELGDLYDWEALGFEVPSYGEAEEIEDAPIPEKVETRTKAGDLWRMGDHALLCGDSGDPENVPRLLKAVGGVQRTCSSPIRPTTSASATTRRQRLPRCATGGQTARSYQTTNSRTARPTSNS